MSGIRYAAMLLLGIGLGLLLMLAGAPGPRAAVSVPSDLMMQTSVTGDPEGFWFYFSISPQYADSFSIANGVISANKKGALFFVTEK